MDKEAAELRTEYLARMRDIPAFMRELKQRFTQWHNRRAKRKGPLCSFLVPPFFHIRSRNHQLIRST